MFIHVTRGVPKISSAAFFIGLYVHPLGGCCRLLVCVFTVFAFDCICSTVSSGEMAITYAKRYSHQQMALDC